MGVSEDSEKVLSRTFQDLSKALNLDKESSKEAWKTFSAANEHYKLDGDPAFWMGCAIYVACRSAAVPTVGKSNVTLQGNLVNLARLLKQTNQSVVEFFQRMKKWTDALTPLNMKPSSNFLLKLEQLEKNFTVSVVVFKSFQPIFLDMFLDPTNDPEKGGKGKKAKVQTVNVWRVFDFTWVLYIYVKANIPHLRGDLVHAYYLLLACCDYIFINVLKSGRKDLINPAFPVTSMSDLSGRSQNDPNPALPSIIDHLCERHNGVAVEAKQIKEYSWKKFLRTMFDKKILKGNSQLLCDVTETSNFELNYKNMNKHYDEYLLSDGDFDERMFLAEFHKHMTTGQNYVRGSLIGCPVLSDSNVQLVQLEKNDNGIKSESNMEVLDIGKHVYGMYPSQNIPPPTPLTGRSYLEAKEKSEDGDGVCSSSLLSLLATRDAVPSETLLRFMKKCQKPPQIKTQLEEMISIIMKDLRADEKRKTIYLDNIISYGILTKKLYYKMMESILLDEERKNPSFNPETLLTQEGFHKTLFACALEVVLFSQSYPHSFDGILSSLKITPYHFYRIIEIVVRNEIVLTREMVKHLNTIEEKILEGLAWKSNSPLWKGILNSDLPIPSCEEVTAKSCLSTLDDDTNNSSSKTEDKLSYLGGQEGVLKLSPGGPLSDKFMSPRPHSGPWKRPADDDPEEPSKKVIVLSVSGDKEDTPTPTSKENVKPKRTGSIALFFRKCYYLASVRMLELCDQLRLSDKELRRKIWTCFEQAIVNHVTLMMDRHLDQIIMCSVYAICKANLPETVYPPFTKILQCYRNQPQSTPPVYRKVLMTPDFTFDEIKNNPDLLKERPNMQEDYKDLINFYNNRFVTRIKNIALGLKSDTSQAGITPSLERIILSPIPVSKSVTLNSMRRLSEKHSVFVRSKNQEKTAAPASPGVKSYHFSHSPAKDLQAINQLVMHGSVNKVGKKLLNDDGDSQTSESSSTGVISKKVFGLCADRMAARKKE